jgi:hypothetical protein
MKPVTVLVSVSNAEALRDCPAAIFLVLLGNQGLLGAVQCIGVDQKTIQFLVHQGREVDMALAWWSNRNVDGLALAVLRLQDEDHGRDVPGAGLGD